MTLCWLSGALLLTTQGYGSLAGAEEPGYGRSPLYTFAKESPSSTRKHFRRTKDNHVAIVNDGYDALMLRVHLIRHAQRSIDIQTLILQNDECGRLIMYELIQAAKRGVHVRLLTDHFMSARDRDWVAFLATAHPNLELKYYRPPANFIDPPRVVELMKVILFFRSYNQRMHNKVMVFDDLLVITGGRNIDNHYYNHSTSYNFLDRDALVFGPVVPQIGQSFQQFWKFRRSVAAQDLTDVAAAIERGDFRRPETREDFEFNGFFGALDSEAEDAQLVRERFVDRLVVPEKVEYIWDRPGKYRGVWIWGAGRVAKRLRKMMGGVEEDLVIQSPYLIMNNRLRRKFRKLHHEKPEVTVTISTNSLAATDNTVAYSANFKLRPSYIQNMGLHIYEYKPHPEDLDALLPNYADLERRADEKGERKPFLSIHAKTIVRDGRLAFVGTHNIDPRSANLNTEVGLLIEDEALAKELREEILRRTTPGSSWVIGRKETPLADVNYLFEGLSGLSPVDIWPLRNTSSFELKDGKTPLSPYDDDFYEHYEDVGSFPGIEEEAGKEIVIHFYKMLGTIAIPVL